MKIEVKVTTRAKLNKVTNDKNNYHIYTTAPPDKGRANASVINLLSKEFSIPKSHISIIKGKTNRNKIVEIS
jgi:uncharacterized protein